MKEDRNHEENYEDLSLSKSFVLSHFKIKILNSWQDPSIEGDHIRKKIQVKKDITKSK